MAGGNPHLAEAVIRYLNLQNRYQDLDDEKKKLPNGSVFLYIDPEEEMPWVRR